MSPDSRPDPAGSLEPIQSLQDWIRRWASLWDVPSLPEAVSISYVDTLRTSLGRCRPSTGEIRLNRPRLRENPHELVPTLCHEAAHVAVRLRFGEEARPHGPEWQELMRLAGHPASRTCALELGEAPKPRGRTLYLHRCPRCRYTHRARTSQLRWACPQCAEQGVQVPLEIAAVYHTSSEPEQ